MAPPSAVLIYDGDCGICTASVRLLQRAGCRAEMVTSRRWALDRPADAERAARAVLLVTEDGSTSEAEAAVSEALRRCRRPLPWLGALIELPGMQWVAGRVYRWVADHRTAISTRLGLTACAVPDPEP